MKPTISFAKESFDRFNRLIFDGRLPVPRFVITEARTYLGMMVTRRCHRADGTAGPNDYTMRLSALRDLPTAEWEDTVIHEMIHFLIAFTGTKDTTAHGPVFRRCMDAINRRYGRHIRISHRAVDLPGPVVPPPAARRGSPWRNVAVLTLRDGRRGFKVVPNTPKLALAYCVQALRSPDVDDIRLFQTADDYFKTYPRSGTLKFYVAEGTALDEHLADAREITWRRYV